MAGGPSIFYFLGVKSEIAILLATCNGSAHLEELVDSVLAQKGPDFTVFASDDGSDDSTPEILAEYALRFPGRFRILDGESRMPKRLGACGHFLWMLENVSADVYLLADQDDIWKEDHLRELLASYEKLSPEERNAPTLAFSDMEVVDGDGTLLAKSFLSSEKLPRKVPRPHFYFVQNNVSGCASLFNRALRDLALSHVEKLEKNLSSIPMHDAFLAATAAVFGKILFVDKPLLKYRVHAKNVLGMQPVTSFAHIALRLRNQGDDSRKAQRFAAFFADYFGEILPAGELRTLSRFASLGKRSKISRVFLLFRSGFLKAGFFRKLSQIVLW